MSQSTTSDLVSTIATQLNIVIVALRLLVDMIQNPDATSPVDMIPGSCPSRPPASPASPLFQTTTRPSISWAPCEQPVPRSELSQTLLRTPPPSPTSTAGTRTPPALPSSPAFCPPLHLSPPPPPLFLPLPLFPPMSLSLLPHSRFLLPPFSPLLTSPTHLPPLGLSHPPPPLPVHSSLPPPMAPFPPVPANAAHLPPLPPPPLPFFLPLLAPTQTPLGKTIGAPRMTTYFSASNAMNAYDPVGATSRRKCSAQNLKSVLVGLNFLNYNGWLHPDYRL